MALIKVKPTSPGRRAVVKVVTPGLHKGKPVAALVEPQSRRAGRNNNGHITVRHQGGGHKQHYRIVDFRRDKDGIQATVERLEYDPNRTAHLAMLQRRGAALHHRAQGRRRRRAIALGL
jgi:large subunit ribosomal protein L2